MFGAVGTTSARDFVWGGIQRCVCYDGGGGGRGGHGL